MLLAGGQGPTILKPTPTIEVIEARPVPTPYSLLSDETKSDDGGWIRLALFWLVIITALFVLGWRFSKTIREKVANKRN